MHVRDELLRLPGISDIFISGQRDYSMRIWVDPDKLAVAEPDGRRRGRRHPRAERPGGLRADRPAAGRRRARRRRSRSTTLGRLKEPEQFADIILRATPDGRIIRITRRRPRRAGGQERGRQLPAATASRRWGLIIFQLPDANALDVADRIHAKMDELAKNFPRRT